MYSLSFIPEGKTIVQDTAFIYDALCQARKAAGLMHAMKMPMVKSVRCKTTCNHFQLKTEGNAA